MNWAKEGVIENGPQGGVGTNGQKQFYLKV